MKKLLLVITFGYLLFCAYFERNHGLSLHFVDEEDNFVLGSYLLRGQKLYSDLYSQHQPLSYVLSSGVQMITRPQSLYQLVMGHREFIIVFSTVFALILVWLFGLPGLAFVLIYEPLKPLLLGNLFLAESLAVYPLLILTGLAVTSRNLKGKKILLLGFLFSWVTLSLSPLWPLLGLLWIILFMQSSQRKQFFLYTLFGALPLLFLCLVFSSPFDYLNSIFYLTPKYYLPFDPTRITPDTLVKSFLSPVISFFSPPTLSLHISQLFSLFLILKIFFINRLPRSQVFLYLAVLGLANIRYISPGNEYYSGFHLLPWLAVLVFIVFISFARSKISILLTGLGMALILPGFMVVKNMNNEYYINYSRLFDIGEAIRIMSAGKNPGKTFVVPDETLVYWQSGTLPATGFLFFYPWMEKSNYYTGQVNRIFAADPPAYFFCECGPGSYFSQYFSQYRQLTKFGKPTELYLNTRFSGSLSPDQLARLDYLGFHL